MHALQKYGFDTFEKNRTGQLQDLIAWTRTSKFAALCVFVFELSCFRAPLRKPRPHTPDAVCQNPESLNPLHIVANAEQEGSRFVFVPGPDDPGLGGSLPQPALPKYFTSEVERVVPNCTFSTNPCRWGWVLMAKGHGSGRHVLSTLTRPTNMLAYLPCWLHATLKV